MSEKKEGKKEAAAEEKISPMLQQYRQIKDMYGDYILFFRLGDFYEMFFDDAKKASEVLDLALTSRAGAPMCGVPFHSAEIYLKRLIDRGYRVAICEQLSDPHASKGLVQRGVIRLVSAGTVLEAGLLSEDKNNYMCAAFNTKEAAGLAFADISTGDVHVFEKKGKLFKEEMTAEIMRFDPVELLICDSFMDIPEVSRYLSDNMKNCLCERLDREMFDDKDFSVISEQFSDGAEISALDKLPLAKKALCALFRYVGNAHKSIIRRFTEINSHSSNENMDLGISAMRNLELVQTMHTKEKRGSLFWVLDSTRTSMGRRMLRNWIERPLTSHSGILERLDAVEELTKNTAVLSDIRESLTGIHDIERLMSRVMYKTASPRDIYAFGLTCGRLPLLKSELSGLSSRLFRNIDSRISPLSEIENLVENAIVEEPPNSLRDGGVIKEGFNAEIDRCRETAGGAQNILSEIELRERERTGIRTLKVGYNRVAGYYIEVSKSFTDKVPEDYIRKQTLTNGERYITEELKKIESDILGANDKALALEQAIFGEVCEFIGTKLSEVQQTACAVAELDTLCSLAQVSLENDYVKPEISFENIIEIKDGRHPVIEKILTEFPFTPNSVRLDCTDNRLLIITGPNMSGKSTFMRQTAIIVLMAQMGCFVPASYAKIGIVDKIFTRVGASDDLTAGQSTFMVEMNEVAEILKYATKKSLVILDEIGRGTSTFDGVSIAKASAEYISGKIGCRTLFATHYHELITLEKEMKGIRNFSVAVQKRGDDIKFLHKIIEGGTDDSYGIEVAKLAGIPDKVISRAKEILSELEVSGKAELAKAIESSRSEQVSFDAVNEQNAIAKIRSVDINTLSPMDALMFVQELKQSLK